MFKGFVVYCKARKMYYQGSGQFGNKPKFYRQKNHASSAINICRNKDSLVIAPATLTIELPEE